MPFQTHPAEIMDGVTYLVASDKTKVPVLFFGQHNLLNVSGAKTVCSKIGITEEMFYEAIGSFKGAANRLEFLAKNDQTTVFKDFAHAPSKVKATTKALKEQYPNRKLFVCLELHTFSSLNKKFLNQYEGALEMADTAVVYFNPEVIKHKQLESISPEEVQTAFKRKDLHVYNDSKALEQMLLQNDWSNTNLVLMSSGTFDGISAKTLAEQITK
jgi:UDP-N-acetylmuramate: L-alanyl-gamma-D-glutamyl-meso-diaminopimelate ligase